MKDLESIDIAQSNLVNMKFNVVGDTLVIFDGLILLCPFGIDETNRKDLISSILFSNLATTKKVNQIKEPILWYNTYSSILQQIGWTIQNFNFSTYQSTTKRYLLPDVIINMLNSNELLIGEKAINLIKEFDDDDESLQLLERPSINSLGQGSIQFLIASQLDGNIFVHFINLSFQTKKAIDNIMWQYFDRSKIELNFSTQGCILNQDIFSPIRDMIDQKLLVANPKIIEISL